MPIAYDSPYGSTCVRCSAFVIAPESSGYVSNHGVRHRWSCENCGNASEVIIGVGAKTSVKMNRAVRRHAVALVA